MKVYCDNCKWSRKKDHSADRLCSNAHFIKFKDTAEREEVEFLPCHSINSNNDCKEYKEVWCKRLIKFIKAVVY